MTKTLPRIRNDTFSSNCRNSFEAVTRLCIQIAYGNFDEDVARYDEDSEMNALEKYAAKFGPSFPVKAYSKVSNKIKGSNLSLEVHTRSTINTI